MRIENLELKITNLPGVGQTYQERLEHLNIRTVKDLLFHYPFRYLDFSEITPINRLMPGQTKAVSGQIIAIKNRPAKFRRMIITEAIIKDQTGSIRVVWFNQPYLERMLAGKEVLLAGKIKRRQGLIMTSPEFELKKRNQTHIGRIVPIYPETRKISSKWLRSKVRSIINLINQVPDFLPSWIREEYYLPKLSVALREIHFPTSRASIKEARDRLAFDELFLIALHSQLSRTRLSLSPAPQISFHQKESRQLIANLPFKLTDAQKRSTWQIIKDLQKKRPMNRILNGDVGSGKTIVAALAMLNTALSGYQAILMAPTEVLAKQHYQTFKNLFKEFNLKTDIYIGSHKSFDLTQKSSSDIIVGTQALIQKGVRFGKLGLAVVDEQHRFGVEQRAKLVQSPHDKSGQAKLKVKSPHFLTMTATPIPRTLSLALYGDLDISFLDEIPKGRRKIITKIISPKGRARAYQAIRQEVEKGRQVLVICPLIEASALPEHQKRPRQERRGQIEQRSVEREYQRLKKEIFPDLRISYLHGQLKPKEKEKIMKEFREKKKDILVSTSVIEVGVDLPNATVMMIEGAERFGLSQLHQFRGRVGRSRFQSFCFLFPQLWTAKVRKRLKVIVSTADGFKIAEEDLKIRGPGEIYGQRQHGLPDLRMASLTDLSLIKRTREAAQEIIQKDPALKSYPQLRGQLREFKAQTHLE